MWFLSVLSLDYWVIKTLQKLIFIAKIMSIYALSGVCCA